MRILLMVFFVATFCQATSKIFPYFSEPKTMKEFFFKHETALSHLETPPRKELRVVTFNVNEFRNVKNSRAFSEFFSFLEKQDADVIALQEVVLSEDLFDWALLSNYMRYACIASVHGSSVVGNIIFTRKKVKTSTSFKMPGIRDQRCAVAVELLVDDNSEEVDASLTVINLQFDNTSDTAFINDQFKAIFSNFPEENKSKNILLVGDFNAVLQGDTHLNDIKNVDMKRYVDTAIITSEALKKYELYQSFLGLNLELPMLTCWSGRSVDHIFYRGSIRPQNSFVLHTPLSDHLPVVFDFSLSLN